MKLSILVLFSVFHVMDCIPCDGPLQPQLLFGCEKDKPMANRICCHNTRYAEHWGYLNDPHVKLFSKINSDGKTTFYDSQCGIPLFTAPVGRTMKEWQQESMHHGWPSFRPEETIQENIVIHAGGEMASTCGTHLGHNLPDANGDRYCIDLVCIAGSPANGTNTSVTVRQKASHQELEEQGKSSTQSGTDNHVRIPEWIVYTGAGLAVAVAVAAFVQRRRNQFSHAQSGEVEVHGTSRSLDQSLAVAKQEKSNTEAHSI